MTIPTVEDFAVILIGIGVGGALAAFVVQALDFFSSGKDWDHDR